MPTPNDTSELSIYREHLERYRATTLQVLDALRDDADLQWRPTPESFTVGQQLLHIAQAEEFYVRGLFEGDWDAARVRLDGEHRERAASRAALRAYFDEVRARTRAGLDTVTDESLAALRHDVPNAPVAGPLRWWLWFLLEHELHHKGQLAIYLRLMGRTAPFYAMPLPLGERPDIGARAALGGV